MSILPLILYTFMLYSDFRTSLSLSYPKSIFRFVSLSLQISHNPVRFRFLYKSKIQALRFLLHWIWNRWPVNWSLRLRSVFSSFESDSIFLEALPWVSHEFLLFWNPLEVSSPTNSLEWLSDRSEIFIKRTDFACIWVQFYRVWLHKLEFWEFYGWKRYKNGLVWFMVPS